MSFESRHPRCPWCGCWGRRAGDRIQCNNPGCAKVSTYTGPAEPLNISVHHVRSPHRIPAPPKRHPPAQDQPNLFDEQEDNP